MKVIRIRTNVAKVMISHPATVDNKMSIYLKKKVKQKQCFKG